MPKSRLKKQYFQPMTLLEVECDVRQRVQLQKLKDARLSTPYVSIPFVPEKLAQSLFVAEFLYHALRSEQQNEPMYAFVSGAMQWLDAAVAGYANFHLAFLMRLSRFLGFYPNLEERGERREIRGEVTIERGGRKEERGEGSGGPEPELFFDLREGHFLTAAPLHRDFLPPAESRLIRLLMRMDFATMHLYRLSRHDRNRILEVLLGYYRLHIPQFPELKSLAVLQELWAD